MIITHNNIILKNEGIILNKITTVPPTPPFTNTYSTSFDGMDDKIELGTQSLGITGSISVSAWAKIPTTNTGGASPNIQQIVCEDAAGGTARNWTLNWRGGSQNTFGGVIWDSGGSAVAATTNAIVPNDNQWHHVMFTYAGDTSTNGLKLFVDGIQRAQATSANGGLRSTTAVTPTIGSLSNSVQWMFEGNIDEVSIFNTDQSANVSTIYNDGIPNNLTDLSPLAWYRNGDNGSYKSPQWLIPSNENKDKVSNYSFEFDGVGDYISFSNNSIGQTQNISYSIWVNLDVTSRQYIVGNQSSSNGGCGLAVESGDVLVFQMGDGGNDSFFNSRVANFSTYAPINTWNHILATWDGTDSKIYINGVLRNTWNPTLPYTISNYSTFWIARRSANTLNTVNGKLDEIALFDSGVSIGDVWDGSGQPIDVSSVSGITNNWRMGEEANFTSNWLVDNSALDNYSKRSFEFDGVDDYVIAPLDGTSTGGVLPILDSDINLTVSLWFKRADTAVKGIFQWGNNLTDASPFILIRSTSLGWQVYFEGAYIFSGNSSVGDWVNLIITRDSVTNIWTVYANGMLVSTYDDGGTALSNRSSAQDIYLGNGYPNYFNGNIDEVAIWNTDETANIATIYNGGEPTTISGAVAHWRMGEDASFNGTNWTVPDNVGSNNGTSANMTIDDLLGEAPNYSGGGISNGMTIEDRIGNAPNSENNALSFNMIEVDRTTDVPT